MQLSTVNPPPVVRSVLPRTLNRASTFENTAFFGKHWIQKTAEGRGPGASRFVQVWKTKYLELEKAFMADGQSTALPFSEPGVTSYGRKHHALYLHLRICERETLVRLETVPDVRRGFFGIMGVVIPADKLEAYNAKEELLRTLHGVGWRNRRVRNTLVKTWRTAGFVEATEPNGDVVIRFEDEVFQHMQTLLEQTRKRSRLDVSADEFQAFAERKSAKKRRRLQAMEGALDALAGVAALMQPVLAIRVEPVVGSAAAEGLSGV